MNRLSKILVLLLIVSILGTFICGCGQENSKQTDVSQSTSAETKTVAEQTTAAEPTIDPAIAEFVTLQVIYPGDLSTRMEEFAQNEMKEKLKKELNCEIKFTWLSWTDYWTKKDVMLAAGEQVDWCWDGIGAINQLVSKKQTQPINELLQKYGQDILKNIPEKFFEAATIDGQIHGIPSTNCPSSSNYQMVYVRQDLLEEVGMTDIKTNEDLEQFGLKVREKYPEMNAAADTANTIRAYARQYLTQNYEYYGDSNIIAIGQNDNKVYSFYETDAYKQAAQFVGRMAKQKLVNEEVAIKINESDARMASGNYLWGTASIGKPSEVLETLKKTVPTGDYQAYLINPGLGKFIAAPGGEVIMIPPTSKYPERAMMFLNWMLKSKDNYNFMLYGVEGKDWVMENNRIKTVTPADSLLHEWMFRNKNYQAFPSLLSQKYIDKYLNWDNDAQYSNCFGFAFDQTPVKDQYANCYAVKGKNFDPITTGFVDFEKNYDKAVSELKKAGIDELIAEYQRQFDKFLASKK